MSTSTPAVPSKKRHPLRTLLSLAVLVGIVVAVKNAIADKGGTYAVPAGPTTAAPTPAAAPEPATVRVATPAAAPEPAPVEEPAAEAPAATVPAPEPAPASTNKVVTAEEIVEAHPKENLDEFAVPVEPKQPIDGTADPARPADDR